MRTPSALPIAALALAVALLSTARPAAAQAAQATVRRADVTAAPVAPAARTLAVYRLGTGRAALPDLPVRVTVADSAGTLVARYLADGAAREATMAVTVMDTDLVLQAQTPSGLLTLLLERQNDAERGELTGRWWLGADGGALRARSAR